MITFFLQERGKTPASLATTEGSSNFKGTGSSSSFSSCSSAQLNYLLSSERRSKAPCSPMTFILFEAEVVVVIPLFDALRLVDNFF
jgi:hypothetical protein